MITIQGVDPNMITNNLPTYPTHPSEVLKDEIEYLKKSLRHSKRDEGTF